MKDQGVCDLHGDGLVLDMDADMDKDKDEKMAIGEEKLFIEFFGGMIDKAVVYANKKD